MKEFVLNIAERMLLVAIFNNVKADIITLRAILDDVKEVVVTEDEKKEINFRPEKIGDIERFVWDKDVTKAVMLSPETVQYALDFIKQKSDAKELSLADTSLLTLEGKLNSKD